VTQLKKQLCEGKKKIKRKNIRKWGYGGREMVILWCQEIFGVPHAALNYGSIPETVTGT